MLGDVVPGALPPTLPPDWVWFVVGVAALAGAIEAVRVVYAVLRGDDGHEW